MITETASTDDTNNSVRKAQWISELSNYIKENPEIKGVIWFNAVDNGVDWTIDSNKSSEKSFEKSFDSYFIQKNPIK